MNFFDYYQSHKNYFWVWEEDADVLAITGGSTIGFREQVAEMLTGIAENGLPSFGSFLLAMIATNKTMDDAVENVAALIKINQREGQAQHTETVKEAFTFLKLLQTVPQEYATGKRRQILLQTIFADSHNRLNISTSKRIAQGLKGNAGNRTGLMRQKDFNATVFFKDFRAIALLLRKFPTAQSIIDAMGDLPALDETEMPLLEYQPADKKTYRDFVDALMDNTKTFHAGALIKPIWAGFKVPIFNAHPSEQPLGGVSDLSNKGDFDKLLISEFANDDLIFMNRIANNEALYIQREMPPVKDELHRNILIDISLKSWGTPKIVAFATYIAIARHPKSTGENSAFAVGDQCIAVSCSNEMEIIDGLQKVDAGLHAAKGLAAFLEANKHDKQLELFFITTADAIRHPDVQRQITSHSSLFKYIITTDAEGEIIFYRRTNNAQKHLQTIRLPLTKLWTKEAPKTEKQQQPLTPAAPPSPAPMLMPTPMHIRKRIPFGDDIYIIADKCLYKRSVEENKKNNKGWQLLLRNVPANSFYELGRTAGGEVQFLFFNPQNKSLCITNLDTLQQAKTSFTSWSGKRYPQFLFNKYRQFIYLVKNPHSFILEPDFSTGNINVKEQLLTSNIYHLDYPKRQKEINDAPAVFSTNILKNISEVYINQSNYLVFNKHQLNAYDGNIISLSTNSSNIKVVKATKYSNVLFRFKDGSKVLIDRSGFITMISSNQDIPDIFIVPAMDANLGIATSLEFAGSEFYFNRNLGAVNVKIEETGANRLSVIKIVKEYSGLGLADVHEAVASTHGKIPAKIYYDDAVKMIAALKEIGCISTIYDQKHQPQHIISARAFYLQNISTFIGHIINYATSD